jgi:hypothetical protein
LAALSVTTRKKDGELREYYIRKVAEGKNKMSVLNAIRAKLVLRMFAIIKFNKFYEQKLCFFICINHKNSKAGKTFDAALKFDENYRVTYDFPEKEVGKGKK